MDKLEIQVLINSRRWMVYKLFGGILISSFCPINSKIISGSLT